MSAEDDEAEREQQLPLTDGAQAEDSRRAWWAPGPFSKLNHNVMLMYLVAVWEGIGDSIWTGTVLVAFLYILADKSNTTVGVVEAAQGLAVALAAVPIGWVADTMGRSRLLKIGGVCSILLIPATGAFAIYAESLGTPSPTWVRWVFLPFMCFWGLASGIITGPAKALFADSLPSLTRSRSYTILNTCTMVSMSIGPAIGVYYFFQHGDDWSLRALRNLILLGLVFELICDVHLLFFDDKKALPREEDTHVQSKPEKASKQTKKLRSGWVTAEQVPALLFVCGLTRSMGSGMTVKFFPLFFKEDLGLSPGRVQLIYLCTPLSIAACSFVVLRLAKPLGRPLAMVVARTFGLCFLVALVVLRNRIDAVYLCIIYVLRTGLMNSTYPLEESIMMDFVPRETRARWKSLQSISTFGWCGSAALGGVIGDHYGYAHTFIITAILQGAGSFPLLLLVPVVPPEHEAERTDAEKAGSRPTAEPGAEVGAAALASPAAWGGSLQQGLAEPIRLPEPQSRSGSPSP